MQRIDQNLPLTVAAVASWISVSIVSVLEYCDFAIAISKGSA